jgi:VTC domain
VISRSRAAAEVANSAAALPSITLADVVEQAALQERVDCKYMVPVDRIAELIARLPRGYAVLEIDRRRGFAYQSVYFDTPDLLTYRQHLQGRRRRYKVRTRVYLDSADCLFEVKLKGPRDQTIKAQLPYPLADRARITATARGARGDQGRVSAQRRGRRAAPAGPAPGVDEQVLHLRCAALPGRPLQSLASHAPPLLRRYFRRTGDVLITRFYSSR